MNECSPLSLSLSLPLSLLSLPLCVHRMAHGCVPAGPKVLPANDPFSLFVSALTTAVPTSAGLTAPPAPLPPAGGGAAPAAPPAEGQLLSLAVPANAFLFGLQANGQHLYVRPCYTLLLNAIQALFHQGRRGVLVKGVAGVGKVRHHRFNGMQNACRLMPRLIMIPLVVLVLCLCVPVTLRCVGHSTLPHTKLHRRL